MITRTKQLILRYIRYYWWRYSDDLLIILGLLFVGYLMYHAYPVDPNAPLF